MKTDKSGRRIAPILIHVVVLVVCLRFGCIGVYGEAVPRLLWHTEDVAVGDSAKHIENDLSFVHVTDVLVGHFAVTMRIHSNLAVWRYCTNALGCMLPFENVPISVGGSMTTPV